MTTSNKMLESMVQEYLDVLRQFSTTTKGVSGNLTKLTKEISPMVQALTQANNTFKIQQLKGRQQMAALDAEFALKSKLNQQTEDLVKLRAREKNQLENIHGEQVRRNIELRHTLEKTVSAFNQLQSAMSRGIGFKKALGMGFKAWTDPMRASHQLKKEESTFADLSGEMYDLGNKSFGGRGRDALKRGKTLSTLMEEAEKAGYTSDDWIKKQPFNQKTQTDYIHARQDYDAVKKQRTTTESHMENAPLFRFLRDHKGLAKVAVLTERFAKWADENKTGIAISIISMGIFVGLLKKMLDASPMLGKMFSLFKTMFDLILRPFGDMIGFFLLPILKVVMSHVLPWFAKVYPIMIQWGLDFGNALTKWDFGGMFKQVIDHLARIVGLLGTPEEQDAARAIAGFGAVGAVGAAVGGKWAVGKVAGKVFGRKGSWGGAGSSTAMAGSQTWGTSKFAKIASKIGWKNLAMFGAKGAFKAIPIAGWAYLAAEVGLAGVKAINPEAYSQLRNDAEWMGLGRDFILPEHTILEGYGAWANDGVSPVGANIEIDGDTYNIYGVDQYTANAVFQERSTLEERNMKRKISEERSTRFS